MEWLVYHTAIDSSFKLVPSVAVVLCYAIDTVPPVTHLMEKRDAGKEYVTTKCSEPQIVIGILFKLVNDVIVNFNMGGITGATERAGHTTLPGIQIRDCD